jgi:hypothetical protein
MCDTALLRQLAQGGRDGINACGRLEVRGVLGYPIKGGPLALRPTTEELARHILNRVYEYTEGRLE